VCTRSRPIASSSSITRVPVASWVRVWSMRRPISVPGIISPETRCEEISFWATLRAITHRYPIRLHLCWPPTS
jgi:hypothetical protein